MREASGEERGEDRRRVRCEAGGGRTEPGVSSGQRPAYSPHTEAPCSCHTELHTFFLRASQSLQSLPWLPLAKFFLCIKPAQSPFHQFPLPTRLSPDGARLQHPIISVMLSVVFQPSVADASWSRCQPG